MVTKSTGKSDNGKLVQLLKSLIGSVQSNADQYRSGSLWPTLGLAGTARASRSLDRKGYLLLGTSIAAIGLAQPQAAQAQTLVTADSVTDNRAEVGAPSIFLNGAVVSCLSDIAILGDGIFAEVINGVNQGIGICFNNPTPVGYELTFQFSPAASQVVTSIAVWSNAGGVATDSELRNFDLEVDYIDSAGITQTFVMDGIDLGDIPAAGYPNTPVTVGLENNGQAVALQNITAIRMSNLDGTPGNMPFREVALVAFQPPSGPANSYPVSTQPISVCPVDTTLFEATFDDRTNGGFRAYANSQNNANPPIPFSALTNNVGNVDGTATDVTIDVTLNGGNGAASPSGGAFVSAFDAAGNSAFWVREGLGNMLAARGGAIYLEKWNWIRNIPAAGIGDVGQDFIIQGTDRRLFYTAPNNTAALEDGEWETIEARVQPGPGWSVMADANSNTNRRYRFGGAISVATQADFDAVLANVVTMGAQVEGIGAFNFGDSSAPTADIAERFALDTVRLVSCVPQGQIGVAKSVGTETVNADGTIDLPYSVLVRNTGSFDLTDIQLSDNLTTQFGSGFVVSNAADTSGGVLTGPVVAASVGTPTLPGTLTTSYDGTGNLLDGTSGNLAPGEEISISFTVRIDPNAANAPLVYENTATGSATDTNTGGTVTDLSNSGIDATSGAGGTGIATSFTPPPPPPEADLITVKTLSSGDNEPAEGDTVTYQIAVRNDGPEDATNVSLTDLLPDGLTATANNGTTDDGSGNAIGTYDSDSGEWLIGTLTNGLAATLTIEGTVNTGEGGNTIENTTTAAIGDQNDPTDDGNDLIESLTVFLDPRLALSPFVCTGDFFQIYTTSGQLARVDLLNNSFQNIGSGSGGTLGPVGYRVSDNLVYALRRAPSGGNFDVLVAVDSTGAVAELGAVSGLPGGSYNTGDFAGDGFLHIRATGTTSGPIYRINVDTQEVVDSYTLNPAISVGSFADMAFDPSSGMIFTVPTGSNQLFAINPTNGATATPITITGAAVGDTGFGAMYADAAGNFYAMSNSSGAVYRIDTSTGASVQIGTGGTASSNDGFSCPSAILTIPEADLVTTKTLSSGDDTPDEGDTVTYQIAVRNDGPADATNVSLTDLLPDGLTATANNGTTDDGSGDAIGTYDAGSGEWLIGTLTNGVTATLTIEGTVDAGQSSETIQNVTTPATGDQVDPNDTTDDLSESVTVLSRSDLSVTKTNTPGENGEVDQDDDTVFSGNTVTYTITVTNNGPDSVPGAVVIDEPDTGLSCLPGDPVVITGDGIPPGTFTIADLIGAGIALGNLDDGQSAVLTYSCTVD